MTTAQKIIKYCAIAFAFFLIFSIVSGILGGIYGLSTILKLKKDTGNIELNNIQLEEYNDLAAYLDIDVNYTNLTIKSGKKFLAQSNNKNIQCKQDGNKLKIEEKSFNWFSKNTKSELVVYIPNGLKFKEVDIETGAGIVNIESIVTEKLKLELGAGKTIIENIIAEKANIETGAGQLTIKSGNINNLDFDIGVGKTEISATLTGKTDIDTGIGALELQLLGQKEDYTFKVNKGIGEIKIDGKSALDNTTIGQGRNVINLNGGIGEIKIEFNKNQIF